MVFCWAKALEFVQKTCLSLTENYCTCVLRNIILMTFSLILVSGQVSILFRYCGICVMVLRFTGQRFDIADRCLPSTPDRDSDLRHAMTSSSTGPAPSSVAGYSLSPLRWSGTGCRITSAPSNRSTPSKLH